MPHNEKEKQDQPIKTQQYVQASPATVSDRSKDYVRKDRSDFPHHLSTTTLCI